MSRVAVLQSNYLPWKGYFDIIHDVELFVFYDEVQFTKNDWRNRNRIVTEKGVKWISVPAGKDLKRRVMDVKLEDDSWQRSHWDMLKAGYSKAPFFREFEGFFRDLYFGRKWEYLYQLNRFLIERISADFLGIRARFADSLDFPSSGQRQEKLLDLLKKTGADVYVSGPSARDYIREQDFTDAGIRVEWKDYSDYPVYRQMHGPFEHQVSIVDLLFNEGKNAPWFIWGHREERKVTG